MKRLAIYFCLILGLGACGDVENPDSTFRSPLEQPTPIIIENLTPSPTPPSPETFSFDSCTKAKDAGAAPLTPGDYGWNSKLDRDKDGVACES